ncbi:MAG TPA: polysaccharide biosynthesis/export family protein [Longimicrobiaceae bacterium]|nr:polysaccharide biosynthesis/export family protein [Longimicrobiaceae bacterium]
MFSIHRCLVQGLLCLAMLLAPGAASAQSAGPADPLRPGDMVRLRIWREPELSGDFPVDEDGVVVLPRIGPLRVAGESPARLQERLVGAYQEFLQHNSIDVVLLRRVQVLGAVRNPGLYPLDPTMTISDALALAGGPTSEGRPNRVELVRDGKRVPVKLSTNTRIASSPIRSGDQLFVPERGWLSRNPGIAAAVVTGAISVLVSLVR